MSDKESNQIWLVAEKQNGECVHHAAFTSEKAAENWVKAHDGAAKAQGLPTLAHLIDIVPMALWP